MKNMISHKFLKTKIFRENNICGKNKKITFFRQITIRKLLAFFKDFEIKSSVDHISDLDLSYDELSIGVHSLTYIR